MGETCQRMGLAFVAGLKSGREQRNRILYSSMRVGEEGPGSFFSLWGFLLMLAGE